jgi:hypothetical protein
MADTSPDRRTHSNKKSIFSHATILEHLIGVADHASIHHYEEDAEGSGEQVACVSAANSPVDMEFTRRYHSEILRFAADFAASGGCDMTVSETKSVLQAMLAEFWHRPGVEVLLPLSRMKTSIYQDNSAQVPMVGPFNLMDLACILIPHQTLRKRFWRGERWQWTEASLALSPPSIRLLTCLSRLPKALKVAMGSASCI